MWRTWPGGHIQSCYLWSNRLRNATLLLKFTFHITILNTICFILKIIFLGMKCKYKLQTSILKMLLKKRHQSRYFCFLLFFLFSSFIKSDVQGFLGASLGFSWHLLRPSGGLLVWSTLWSRSSESSKPKERPHYSMKTTSSHFMSSRTGKKWDPIRHKQTWMTAGY